MRCRCNLREVRESAPGRVNLIGEHTDYNGGYVLPMAIPQRTHVELRVRDDALVTARSEDIRGESTYALGAESCSGDWVDYVRGVTYFARKARFRIGGFDLGIRSAVPVGSGLSSSAALCVALLRALRAAFDLDLDDVKLALLAQQVETDFVGAPVGVMDQMASSLADERTALFLDTRTLAHERVALPPGIGILVVNSGIPHSHATGDYRTRRAECEEAARVLGVRQLRDATAAAVGRLSGKLLRRARHVVTENERVLAAVTALREGSGERLGRLFLESHASMRDDFEISIPEIDRLVEIAAADPCIFGARLTGGGFGGSIVAVARADEIAQTAVRVVLDSQRAGLRPSLLVPQVQY